MSSPNISFVAALKDTASKGIEKPVVIYVYYQRRKIPVQTGFKAHPGNFDKYGMIGDKDENYRYKNNQIKKQIAELERKVLRYIDDGNEFDFDVLRALVRGNNTSGKTLSNIKDAVEIIYRDKVSNRTCQFWATTVGMLNAFNKENKKGEVRLSDLTKEFFIRYEGWRLKSASYNTLWGDFKVLKSILSKAEKHGVIDKSPMKGVEMPKYKETVKAYLTPDEVDKIEDYANNGGVTRYRNVAAWFVLSCRSGLRYDDLNNWDEGNMIIGDDLYFSDQKEETPHFIPLYPELKRAIERVRGSKIPVNQKCNDYLKEIAIAKEINKNLTMHVGRHTFAVNYLNRGGDIKVLQNLMGHKKLSTTEVYGKITSKRIKDEVKKVLG